MWLYRIINWLVKIIFFRLLYPRKIYGKENMPSSGPVLIACNHMRFHDIFNVATCFKRRVRFMAKRELIEMPFWGKLMTCYGAFPVDREHIDPGAIRLAIKILQAGGVVCIFPQGTRVHEQALGPLKGGVAYIAGKTGCTVLPMYINNSEKLFRRTYTIVGKPFRFEPAEKMNSDYIDQATALLRTRMLELCIYDHKTGAMGKWHEEK